MIELMVAIAVLAVLVTVAMPGFQELVKRNRMTVASNTVLSALANARSEAISRNVRVTICKSNDASTCNASLNWENGALIFVDPDSDGVRDPGEPMVEFFEGLANGYTLRTGGTFANWVGYRPTGESVGSGGLGADTFLVCGPDGVEVDARRIVINAVGRARTDKGAGTKGPCP